MIGLNMAVRARRLLTTLSLAAVALTTTAAPTHAAPGDGTLEVNFVHDSGQPATVLVSFVDAEGGITSQTQATSSFPGSLAAGTKYGVILIGGWGGITCVHLAPCSWPAVTSNPLDAHPTADAPTVTEGAVTSVSATIPTPKLSGTGEVGSPLTITVPSTLSGIAGYFAARYGGSPDPGVTWMRNGVQIPGASGLSFTPTTADAGSTIAAVVSYPTALTSTWGPSVVPGPLTTAGITVPAIPSTPVTPVTPVTPTIKLAVPAKIKQGKRPKVYITVKDGAAAVPGIVKLKVGKKRALQATLRSGLATFSLPRLKPGRYVVTAIYPSTTGYASATTSKRITVKKATRPRKR